MVGSGLSLALRSSVYHWSHSARRNSTVGRLQELGPRLDAQPGVARRGRAPRVLVAVEVVADAAVADWRAPLGQHQGELTHGTSKGHVQVWRHSLMVCASFR